MSLGDSYATTAELKTRLSISDGVDDTPLTNSLAAASREIEKFCHRQFNDAGSASARVFVPLTDCKAYVDDFSTTTGLIIKTDTDGDGVYETTWSSTDYELYPLNNIVEGDTGWPYWKIGAIGNQRFPLPYYSRRRAVLQVTARWGWTAVPAPIKEACLIAAEETFKYKDAPFVPAVRISGNRNLEKMLRPYRRNVA